MKKNVFVFLLFTTGLCAVSFAQQRAVTDSGRIVMLNDNGTWQYEETVSASDIAEVGADTVVDASYKKYFRPAASKAILKSERNKSAIWYNTQVWRKNSSAFSEASEFSMTTVKGDGYCTIVTEALQLTYAIMKEAVVKNAQNLSTDFTITSEEFRNVNGKRVMCLTAKASNKGMKFSFMYYIYTGSTGTTQLICYTSDNIFNQRKKDFEDLMNGFVILR
jgi:hypothetical protein